MMANKSVHKFSTGWSSSQSWQKTDGLWIFIAITLILVCWPIVSIHAQSANGIASTGPPCTRSPVSVPVSRVPYNHEEALKIEGPDLTTGSYIAWMNWNGTWYATSPENLEAGYKYVVFACTSEHCNLKVFLA